MSLNDKATAALTRELAKCFPERDANDPGHAKLAAALSDTARSIEARLTLCGGTVETEVFDTVEDAHAWIRRRVRQLEAEGVSVHSDDLKREVFRRLPIARAEGGAK